jgi:hypothetical protein
LCGKAYCPNLALAQCYKVTLPLRPKPQIGGNRPDCDMRWFRSNRKTGGRLALFALAVQFVLAFGHIHPQDIYGPLVSSATLSALPAPENVQSLSTDQASKQSDDFCAICATVLLLNNSFAAEAPDLPLPVASRAVLEPDRLTSIFVEQRRAAFQSRAPPTA